MSLIIDRLCIIGAGLIGGSFALALKQAGAVNHIRAAGRSEATLQQARALGLIDDYRTDIAEAVADADVVFVSVPLGAMPAVFEQIEAGLRAAGNTRAIITDAGSAKLEVQRIAEATLSQPSRFVAGHPIAGTEKSGPQAAFAELYRQRRVILTPVAATGREAIDTVTALWRATGAEVEIMDAAHHDKVLAATSHLPHLIAFGLVHCLENIDDIENVFRFAAGGFRDVTRIASSDPVMWRDICLANREPILDMLQRYRREMDMLYNALAEGDGEALKTVFEHAKQTRDRFTH